MGGECVCHGRDGKRIQILVGILERRGTLGICVKIKWLLKTCGEDFGWIQLNEDAAQSMAFVNTVVNFWIAQEEGNSLTSW
jgi:hypothetical protein